MFRLLFDKGTEKFQLSEFGVAIGIVTEGNPVEKSNKYNCDADTDHNYDFFKRWFLFVNL